MQMGGPEYHHIISRTGLSQTFRTLGAARRAHRRFGGEVIEIVDSMGKRVAYVVAQTERGNPRGQSAFDRCVESVAARGSADDPRAVCAVQGVRKFGQAEMTRRAIAGRKRAARRRGNASVTVADHKADFYREGFTEGKKERGQEYPVLGPDRASGQGEFMAQRLVDHYGLPQSKAGTVAAEFTRGYFDGYHGKRRGAGAKRANQRLRYYARPGVVGIGGGERVEGWDIIDRVTGDVVRHIKTKSAARQVLASMNGRALARGEAYGPIRENPSDEKWAGSRVVRMWSNDGRKWEGRLYVNGGETATLTTKRGVTKSTLDRWADKVLRQNPAGPSDRRRNNDEEKVCKDCGRRIPELEAFPGPRCLGCHAKKWEHMPLERPDFVGAIRGVKRGRRVKGNPAEAARAVSEEFHGRPVREMVPVTETRHYHKFLAELGELRKLVIHTPDGRHKVQVSKFGGALLCSNEDKNQLFIKGGDQTVNLRDFGIRDAHEQEHLGELRKIEYFTDKEHLGSEGGTAVYVHSFSRPYPHVDFRLRDSHLEISGGKYKITPEGIVG